MKPDDVSQEAWGAACDCWEELASSAPLRDHETVVIARAITAAVSAEREAWQTEVAEWRYQFVRARTAADKSEDAASRLRYPDTTGQ